MRTVVEELRSVDAQQGMLLPGVVGFFFSFRVFILLLMVRVLQAEPRTGAATGVALNLLLLVVVAYHSIGPAPRTLLSTLQVTSFRWVLVYLGFSGCSLLWSSTASLSAAVLYWCAMAADVAMVVLLLRTGPVDRAVVALMKGFVWGACATSIVAWVLPAQSDLRLGDEELLGPNQIGYVCAFALFFAQYLIRREGRWKIAAAFLAITLLRSLSKTSILAVIAGEAVILARDASMSRKSKIAILLTVGLVIGMFWGLLESYYDVYSNAGNQSESLTGRIGIWAFFLDSAFEQPWIGHGFHSVWKVVPLFYDGFEARHAHNELLQQFYAYGLAGVLILVGLYGSFYRRLRQLPSSPVKALFFGLLVFALVRGLADTEVFDVSLPLWAITMISLMLSPFADVYEAPAPFRHGSLLLAKEWEQARL